MEQIDPNMGLSVFKAHVSYLSKYDMYHSANVVRRPSLTLG
jgi:hypothetical protein